MGGFGSTPWDQREGSGGRRPLARHQPAQLGRAPAAGLLGRLVVDAQRRACRQHCCPSRPVTRVRNGLRLGAAEEEGLERSSPVTETTSHETPRLTLRNFTSGPYEPALSREQPEGSNPCPPLGSVRGSCHHFRRVRSADFDGTGAYKRIAEVVRHPRTAHFLLFS
jgi:hypothetical protein